MPAEESPGIAALIFENSFVADGVDRYRRTWPDRQ
jgi:hypothetical protein